MKFSPLGRLSQRGEFCIEKKRENFYENVFTIDFTNIFIYTMNNDGSRRIMKGRL